MVEQDYITQAQADGWTCTCGAVNKGKFLWKC